MSIVFWSVTDPGRVRKNNEDRVLTASSLGLYAVCDGMGGEESGEVAAELAVETMRYYIDSSSYPDGADFPYGYDAGLSQDANRMATALREANKKIRRLGTASSRHAGMGTTIAAVLMNGPRATIGHVGDSRVYHWFPHGAEGVLERWTEDDSMVQNLVRRGLLSQEDAAHHPMNNVLSQAVGTADEVNPHCREEVLQSGDRLLICSDGLHGMLSDGEIGAELGRGAGVTETAEQLVRLALERGATDNVSVVLLQYD